MKLTDAAKHNMGSVAEPHYVVDVEFAYRLEAVLIALVNALGETPAGEAPSGRDNQQSGTSSPAPLRLLPDLGWRDCLCRPDHQPHKEDWQAPRSR